MTLEEIAVRGAQAVEELRGRAGLLARLFLYRGRELIDLDSTPDTVKQRIMDDVEKLNRWLGMYPLWMRSIGRLILEARRTTRGKPVRVLDVGAGHGRLLFEIEDWARKRRVAVDLHGVEFDPASVQKAQRVAGEEGRRARIVVGDGRQLPYETGGMDVVCSTFMMHHLPSGDVARVLAEMDRVAAVNWFVFDVRRTMVVFPGLWALLRVGAFEAPSRHDALASLRRSYTADELDALLRAAGVENAAVKAIPPSFLMATRA